MIVRHEQEIGNCIEKPTRCGSDSLRVDEVTRIVIADAYRHRGVWEVGADFVEKLEDISHTAGEGSTRLAEPALGLTERRAATGGGHDDCIERAEFTIEGENVLPRQLTRKFENRIRDWA